MAYIGRGTDNISNVEVLDNITFDGSSTYTLQKGSVNFVPTSANNILLSIDGVVQANNFSVSTSTIDFGVAIASTSTCNFVLHFGTGLVTTVQDGAITSAKLGADSVTYAKLQNLATANRVLGSASTGLIGETQIATAMVADDAITYGKMQDTVGANKVLGAVTAGTIGEVTIATDMLTDASVDEAKLKISNAPTNGYFLSAQSGDTGGLTWAEAGGANTPSFFAHVSADYSISDSNHHIIAANTELWDTDSAYDNTATNYKFTVPSGKAGKYQFTIGYKVYHSSTGIFVWQTELYKNGSWFIGTANSISPNDLTNVSQSETFTVDLAAADYIQAYTYIDNANNTAMDVKGGSGPIYTCFSGFKLL